MLQGKHGPRKIIGQNPTTVLQGDTHWQSRETKRRSITKVEPGVTRAVNKPEKNGAGVITQRRTRRCSSISKPKTLREHQANLSRFLLADTVSTPEGGRSL